MAKRSLVADVPETVRRGIARHDVPGFRLPRLATDLRWHGQGLAGQLLAAAARWYQGYGAVPFDSRPLKLVLPLATFAAGLKAAAQL